MKRVLVASILGLAASVASSYGQANYFFDTYLPNAPALGPSGQVVWSGVGTPFSGTASDNQNLVANLLWQVGTASGIANVAPIGVDMYGFIETNLSTPNGPGYTTVSFMPTYAGGAIDFTIQIWQTGGSVTGFGDALYTGSISWTDPGTAPAGPSAVFDAASFPGGNIVITAAVPEPTTMAFLGLGAAAMFLFRKRQ